MSFFGFDTTLPRDRSHQKSAPGFAAPQDAFASLPAHTAGDDETEPLDFEDTYEGFRSRLDDTADDLNDDTFGDAPATQEDVGRDFDFSGRTGNVAQAFEEERMLWAAQHTSGRLSPPKQTAKPKRTGYEYLEADADLWGIAPKREPEPAKPTASARKALTLEEVEAMMQAGGKKVSAQPAPGPQVDFAQAQQPFPHPLGQPQFQQQPFRHSPPAAPYAQPPQILQRPQQAQQAPSVEPQRSQQQEVPSYGAHHPPQILQRQRPPSQPEQSQPQPATGPRQQRKPPTGPQHPVQPRQILQNPNRLSGPGQPLAAPQQSGPQFRQGHARDSSYNGPVITNPSQILQLSDDDRAAYLQEEARRAKRNHKIHLLSKYNGLMTPQDKNFITRIQLQQLVTATGTVDAVGPESLLNEDFYYQVYAQIRGAPRQNPHQPANQFAQTYLFQTGGRYGHGRRHPRGGENHMQRMEQQVQRAVEAARAKPKNSQLVIEGSLGKISFSNAKTPKPLLNIKRPEGDLRPSPISKRSSRNHDATAERRETLKNIENVYAILMETEDIMRQEPREAGPAYDEWAVRYGDFRERLWKGIKADVPLSEK
jgi:DNA topoisomerase 2-associated protein PAT1